MRQGTLAALVVACTLASGAPAYAAPTPVTGTAAAFADSVGVNIHTFYPDTAYADKARLRSLLLELGVKHVRDGIAYEREAYKTEYPAARAIAAAGIRFLWVAGQLPAHSYSASVIASPMAAGAPRVRPPREAMDLLSDPRRLGGTAEAVEGPNESDNPRQRYGVGAGSATFNPAWASELRSFMDSYFRGFKGDARFAGIPFWAPSFMTQAGRTEYAAQPGAADLMDRPNAHAYPGGKPPEETIPSEMDAVAGAFGDVGRRPVVTETGYHNAVNYQNRWHHGVSERAQAIYLARAVLTSFAAGAPRTYIYQLLDQSPEPGLRDKEEHFGLVGVSGKGRDPDGWTVRRKPAFNTIRELLSLARDGGSGAAPASLDYSLSGAPSTLKQVVLGRRGGAVDLVLWNAVPVYSPGSGDLTPEDVPVSLSLGAPARVTTQRPYSQTSFTLRGSGVRFALRIGADPVFVRIKP